MYSTCAYVNVNVYCINFTHYYLTNTLKFDIQQYVVFALRTVLSQIVQFSYD